MSKWMLHEYVSSALKFSISTGMLNSFSFNSPLRRNRRVGKPKTSFHIQPLIRFHQIIPGSTVWLLQSIYFSKLGNERVQGGKRGPRLCLECCSSQQVIGNLTFLPRLIEHAEQEGAVLFPRHGICFDSFWYSFVFKERSIVLVRSLENGQNDSVGDRNHLPYLKVPSALIFSTQHVTEAPICFLCIDQHSTPYTQIIVPLTHD